MNMLGAVLTVGAIIGASLMAWSYTKSGKKWLDSL